MSYKINVVIEKDEYGYYAYCPELYLETLPKDEIIVPFHPGRILHPKVVKQVLERIEEQD